MAIITNKPTSVSADSTTSLELNKADLQAKLEALSAGAYWEDQSTWRGVAFLFENASKQKVIASFDASGNTADLSVSEFFVDGDIECKRIDILGFANDHYTIYREDFTSASEFDIEITDGYASGGGGGGGGGPVSTLALYHFDNDGNDVYGNNLTQIGTITYNPGKFNQGASDFSVNLAYFKRDATFLNTIGANDFTIECWVKLENSASLQDLICTFQDPSPGIIPTIRPFSLTYSASSNFLHWQSSGANLTSIDLAGKRDGNWHHLVVQRNSGVVRGFVDGVLANSPTSIADSIPSSSYEFSIGFGGSAYPYRWEGGIDELRISNAAIYNIAGFTPPNAAFNESGGGGGGGNLGYVTWNVNQNHTVEADGGIYGGDSGGNLWAIDTSNPIADSANGEFTFIINDVSEIPNDFAFGIGNPSGNDFLSQNIANYFGLCWINGGLSLMVKEFVDTDTDAPVMLSGENTIRIAREGELMAIYVNGSLFYSYNSTMAPNYSFASGTLIPAVRTKINSENTGIISAYRSL